VNRRVEATIAIVVISLTAVGCSASQVPSASAWAGAATTAPTATAAPTPSMAASTPAPTRDTRLPLAYPDVQSHGTLMIAFRSPTLPVLRTDLVCEWASPTLVGSFYEPPNTAFGGETVSLEFLPNSDTGPLFEIGREDAASYRAGPTTGTIGVTSHAADWSNGQLDFADLAPDPETALPGPIPTPLSTWVRPIGNDPFLARLTGTVSWTCEPAPPTVAIPGPVVSEAPGPTMPPIPKLALVEGDRHDFGVDGCGAGGDIDGYVFGESCGPSFQAPGDEHIVRIRAGTKLRFELPTGWHVTTWSVGWVTTAEAVRWRGEQPDTFRQVAHDDSSSGRVLEVTAPPTGDWTVFVSWSAARGDDSISWPDYFRVVVGN
jgi:hypothetical protein